MNYILSGFADEASPLLYMQIEAMKKNGVDALEMRGVNGRNISDMTVEEVKCASYMLKNAGISVSSIGSPIGKINITDDFSTHLEKFKKIIEYAVICSAKYIRIFSYYGVDSAEKKNEVFEKLSAFADAAKGSGVILCHENEKGIFGYNAENCLEIFQNVGSIRGVFDPANFVQCGVNTKAAWNLLVDHIEYIHVKDALESGTVVPAGQGIGNLEYIMREYAKTRGDLLQTYSLEPHLKIFSGFAALENKTVSISNSENVYPDGMSAFAASADAAKLILDRIYN